MEYQDSFPPVHQMIAAYFNIKPKASASNSSGNTEQKFDEVIYELLSTASPQPTNKKNKGIRML